MGERKSERRSARFNPSKNECFAQREPRRVRARRRESNRNYFLRRRVRHKKYLTGRKRASQFPQETDECAAATCNSVKCNACIAFESVSNTFDTRKKASAEALACLI
jgi:hypothetical protein